MTPYRSGPRVEHRIRALSADEALYIEQQRTAWHARLRRTRWGTVAARIVTIGAAALLVLALANAVHELTSPPSIALLLFVAIIAMGAVIGTRAELSPSPWDAPAGGFEVRETTLAPRSVLACEWWMLFELRGGEWYFVDRKHLPPGAPLDREEIHLRQLWPDGRFLSANARGDAIPLRELPQSRRRPNRRSRKRNMLMKSR
jgi:hypothetical protein